VTAGHLPILQVVVPLIAAPVCALLRRDTAAWALALVVSWATLLMALGLLNQVWGGGTVVYYIGSWPAPWGIEYRVDAINALVLVIVSGIGAMVMTFARASVRLEIARTKRSLFYTAYLLCLAGLLGIAITGDAFNAFVFLEINSLSAYVLVSLGRDRRALTAAYQYLIMGTIGATFILIGVGLLYVVTGTLNMVDLAQLIPEVEETRTLRAAFAFLTVGVGLKLALFPLHLWLPNAYAFAPSVVAAFLAGTATKVAVYIMMRAFFTIFGAEFSFDTMQLDLVLLPLALVGIFSASLTAIFQINVARMLAYSSIAQIGYMLLGVSLTSMTGLMAAVIHLFNHAIMKGALFLALGCVAYRIGGLRIDRFAGLGRQMPWTMAAFVVGGMSLIGVPFTAGFVSKWYLILGTIEKGWWPAAVLVLGTSLMAVIYIWRVVEVAYFRPLPKGRDVVSEAPLSMLIPTWMLAAANLVFGVDPSFVTEAARQAAFALMGDAG
jgi:multicomponent Na+:H+ antiporter subunit D